jgi:hypothetical protein
MNKRRLHSEGVIWGGVGPELSFVVTCRRSVRNTEYVPEDGNLKFCGALGDGGHTCQQHVFLSHCVHYVSAPQRAVTYIRCMAGKPRREQRSAKLAFVALLATRHTSFPFHCSTEAVPKTACEKAEVCSVLQIVVSLYINTNPIDSTLSTHRRATLPNTPTPQPLCCQLPSSSHIKSAQ